MLVYTRDVGHVRHTRIAIELGVLVSKDPAAAKTWLLELMRSARYVKAEAARRLGISTTLLRSWIQRLGMDDVLTQLAVEEGYVLSSRRQSPRNAACPDPAFVYFIQAGEGGPVKIGWSSNIKVRMESAQVDNPEPLALLAYVPGGPEIEARLHHRFREAHLRGEWFRPVRDLLDLIEEIVDRGLDIRTYLDCES